MLPPLLAKLDTQQTLVAAHRGASGHFVENTIEAFEKAIELGADMIELDVRLTKDKQLICYHDDTINGTPIDSLNYNQIEDKNIPLLDVVLEKFHDKIYFVLEVKPPRTESSSGDPTPSNNLHIPPDVWLALVSKYNLFGRVVFASEDLQYLFFLKQTLKGKVFYCAVLSSAIANTWEQDIRGLDGIICSIVELETLFTPGSNRLFASPTFHEDSTATSSNAKRRSHLPATVIGVYGVRTKEDIALCGQYNVRFIGTDYPSIFIND